MEPLDKLRHRNVLVLAFDRGKRLSTFATRDEMNEKGYSAAWALGKSLYADLNSVIEPHTLIACGCPHCRFERIVKESQ